jgi:hypothetical protein
MTMEEGCTPGATEQDDTLELLTFDRPSSTLLNSQITWKVLLPCHADWITILSMLSGCMIDFGIINELT